MKKRNLTVFTLVAWMTMSTVLTACGGTKEEPGKKDSGASEVTELELFMSKPETADVMQEIADKFCEENPGVKISVTATADGQTVLQTRLASDEMPDILNTFPAEDFYKNMFTEGYIEEITGQEFLKKASADSLKLSECTDGKYYAVPMSLSTYGVYTNMTVLKENGIMDTPRDWEEFIQDLQILKENGVTGILLPDKDVGNVAQRFERTVGIINNDSDSEFRKIADGKMEAKDSSTLNAYVEYNKELLEYANEDHMGMDYDVAVAQFSEGEAGFMISGTWMLSTVKQNNPDADIKLFPFYNPTGGDTKVPTNIDTAFSISSKCKDKEIGLKFLEYMTKPEIAQMYCDIDGNVSTIEGVTYDIPEHQVILDEVNKGNIFLTAVNFWPTGLREEIRPYCQQFLSDMDEETFYGSAQDAITMIYADSE